MREKVLKPYVCVIGTANVDICGYPYSTLIPKTSNIGRITVTIGGVGRNIAENLARIGVNTKLITAVGSDDYGRMITEYSSSAGIDTSELIRIAGAESSTYMAILDTNNDMALAVSDSKILDNMTVDVIKTKLDLIRNSQACVIDAGVSKEVMRFITDNCPQTTFFLDTISPKKSYKILGYLGNFHTIKPNIYEAEVLAEMKIKTKDDIVRASEIFIGQGVRDVFISLGQEGVFYNNGETKGFMKLKEVKLVNATGAGDALASGLVYGYLKELDIVETVKFALTAAYIALSGEDAVNPNMSLNLIKEKMKEIEYVG